MRPHKYPASQPEALRFPDVHLMMRINRGIEGLRKWLLEQPPERTFSVNDQELCPVAAYINDTAPPGGGGYYYTPGGTDGHKRGPFTAFGLLVDAEPGPTVTVARCLELLDRAEAGQ